MDVVAGETDGHDAIGREMADQRLEPQDGWVDTAEWVERQVGDADRHIGVIAGSGEKIE